MRSKLPGAPTETGRAVYDRGYQPPRHARGFLRECHDTRALLTCACAAADHLAIVLLAAVGYWGYLHMPLAAILLTYPLLAVAIARFQRALECLVHEAAHYNWLRSSHTLNDRLAGWLAARPVFADVAEYRRGHQPHHSGFGGEHDPDLARYRELGVEEMDREHVLSLTAGMARRILAYADGWWRANRTHPGTFALGLYWHLTCLIAPATAVVGPRAALLVWAAFWFAPFTLVLPWQRFLAETAKHQYHGHVTMVESTVSNIGFIHRWLLHPHNDGFHLVHHLFPGIPHHRLAQAHRGLMCLDPEGYGRMVRQRRHLMQRPEGVGAQSHGGHRERAMKADAEETRIKALSA